MKLRIQIPSLIAIAAAAMFALAGCDSSPQIATVTQRAKETRMVGVTLTIAAGGSITTPTPIVVSTGAATPVPAVGTAQATGGATAGPNPINTAGAQPTGAGTASIAQPGTQQVGGTPVPRPGVTAAATSPATAQTGAITTTPTVAPGTGIPTGVGTLSIAQPGTQVATSVPPTVAPPAGTVTAGASATKVAAAPQADTNSAGPTATPFNSILATVAMSRTLTAAAPTATPIAVAASPVDWFNHATLYSVYVRSFRDSNGDGIGDLKGVTDGLDYLQSLGVDTIWLLPVFKSPSVHGYDITDYYAVNPDYGSNDDLIRLIRAVHQRKMHILLDYVVNHTSDQHPNFKDAYNNPKSVFSDLYIWNNPEHTQYATFAGVQSMPKLNYDSPATVKFSTDIALYWLDPNKDGDLSDGVDGYRADVATGPFKTFWKSLRASMNALNPKAVLLGELFVQTPQDMSGYLGDDRLDAAFDYPLFIRMTGNWDENGDGVFSGKGDPALAFGMARSPRSYYPVSARLVRFIDNHDTNRIMSDVEGDINRAKAAAVFMLTNPGPIVIYYGDEIGMVGSKCGAPDYDSCRREPFKWNAANGGPNQATWFTRNNQADSGISVAEQDGKDGTLLALYRTFGKLRATPVMQSATWDMPEIAGKPSLYVVRQYTRDEIIVTAINFGTEPTFFDALAPLRKVGADSYGGVASVIAQNLADQTGDSWKLGAGGFVVLKTAR